MKKIRGFSLIELMVILAVVAIIAAFGVPQISRMLQTNRTVTALNSLSAHLNLARSEAVRRSSSVSVAGLDPAKPAQWELGWVVFVDTNTNGALDAGEKELRVVNALDIPNFTITPDVNSVTYERLGAVIAENSFTLTEYGQPSRTLKVSATGHVSIP